MTDEITQEELGPIGPWIPEIFRTMKACDRNGDMWEIDQATWTWVRMKPKHQSEEAKP